MRWAAAPGQQPTPYRAPPPPVKKGGGCLKWLLFLMGGSFLLSVGIEEGSDIFRVDALH